MSDPIITNIDNESPEALARIAAITAGVVKELTEERDILSAALAESLSIIADLSSALDKAGRDLLSASVGGKTSQRLLGASGRARAFLARQNGG